MKFSAHPIVGQTDPRNPDAEIQAVLSTAAVLDELARRRRLARLRGIKRLYVCVVMEPRSRKSQTLEKITAPLRAFKREEYAKIEPVIPASRSEQEIQESQLRNLRAMSAKCQKPAEREALAEQLQEITSDMAEVPVAPRLLADDVTPEKLASIMAQQAGVRRSFPRKAAYSERSPVGIATGKPTLIYSSRRMRAKNTGAIGRTGPRGTSGTAA